MEAGTSGREVERRTAQIAEGCCIAVNGSKAMRSTFHLLHAPDFLGYDGGACRWHGNMPTSSSRTAAQEAREPVA